MIKEQQEDEVQVLQAVYLNDFVDLRNKDVWKVWRPPEFRITLYPSNAESQPGCSEMSVDILVHFKAKYPSEVPAFKFLNARQISEKDLATLLANVKDLALSLKGQVMIMEICQFVQEFLRETLSRKNSTDSRFKSFHEGMITHQMQQENIMKDALQKQQDAEFERQASDWRKIESEIKKRVDEKRLDLIKRKQDLSLNVENDLQLPPFTASHTKRDSSRNAMKSHITCSSMPTQRIDSHNLIGTKVSIRMTNTSTGAPAIISSLKIDPSPYCISYECLNEDTKETVSVSEWKLRWSKKCSNTDYLSKEIQSLEKEYQSLVKLRHTNLISYISLNVVQNVNSCVFYVAKFHEAESIQVSVLCERGFSPKIDYVRLLCRDVLRAIEFLHSKGILHRAISLHCILDCKRRFLLSDFSVRKKLNDLCDYFKTDLAVEPTSTEQSSLQPFFYYGMGKMNQKLDIFMLGVCVTALSSSKVVQDNAVFKVPADLPSDLRNFLQKMTISNEEERWAAKQLLSHSFLLTAGVENSERDAFTNVQKIDVSRSSSIESGDDMHSIPSLAVTPQWNRLDNEFDSLKFLGRGGFGDVLKVRNKLDGCVYAIKRIVLQPSKREENRKITREVKLLSRLNHENVVRYYNSWIERAIEADRSSESVTSASSDNKALGNDAVVKEAKNISFAFDVDAIENKAPPPRVDSSTAFEWSVSTSRHRDVDFSTNRSFASSSDDDDGDSGEGDGNAVFGNLFYDGRRLSDGDDDDVIVFGDGIAEPNEPQNNGLIERNGAVSSDTSSDQQIKSVENRQSAPNGDVEYQSVDNFVQILYIQMEFCEKSTLRQIIDDGELYTDPQRAWKLFREICEGLAYIHKQGMIHRDLKPVNIFLDSNDYAKIGDFGLATHDLLANQLTAAHLSAAALSIDFLATAPLTQESEVQINELTTRIGTALYIAPELRIAGKKPYSQHVDIYSLGIILFEIFYRPLGTGMERVKILTDIRKPDVQLPEDFSSNPAYRNQNKLLKWLLQHDARSRPSADELLRSDLLPPIEMQQSDFQLAISSALADTQTRQYKWLMGAVMNQQPSMVQDYVYDNDMYKGSFSVKDAMAVRVATEKLQKIFNLHGLVRVDTPLLLPKNKLLSECIYSRVDMMDESGLLLHLPYDLHIPFARYAVRNNIVHLKRFCIAPVYRNPGHLESHPREITECAMDFITSPTCCSASNAELLSIITEIIREFPALNDKNFMIKLNHTSITKAIIMHCGIEKAEQQRKVMDIIVDYWARKIGKQRRDQKLLYELNLSDRILSTLTDLLETDDALSKVASKLRIITKKDHQTASSLAKEGLHELEVLLSHCESFQVNLPITVCPQVLFSLYEYSGTLFQVVCQQKSKTGHQPFRTNVFAAGGRYDKLLERFREPMASRALTAASAASAALSAQSCVGGAAAVGASFAFDAVASSCAARGSPFDALVCSVGGRKIMLKEKLRMTKALWVIGVKADYIQEPVGDLEELQDFCRKNGVEFLIVFKDSESGVVRLKSWDGEKCIEKKLSIFDVSAYLQERCSAQTPKCDTSIDAPIVQTRSHGSENSGGPSSGQFAGVANLSSVKVHFATIEKLVTSVRRRIEFQMSTAVSTVLKRFSNRETIDVVITDLPGQVIKFFAAIVDWSTESAYQASSRELFGKFNKHKQQLSLVTEEVFKLKFDERHASNILLLYSYVDDVFRILL